MINQNHRGNSLQEKITQGYLHLHRHCDQHHRQQSVLQTNERDCAKGWMQETKKWVRFHSCCWARRLRQRQLWLPGTSKENTRVHRAPYVFSPGSKQDIIRGVDKGLQCHKSQGEERACFQKAAKATEGSVVKNLLRKHVRERHSKMFLLPATGILGGFSVIHACVQLWGFVLENGIHFDSTCVH